MDKIRNYHGPLLQSHGTADGLIPFAMGRQLFEEELQEDRDLKELRAAKAEVVKAHSCSVRCSLAR